MLRFRPSFDASAGYHYFSKSDAGLDANELRKEVGGLAAERLGVIAPDFDQFKNLLHGLHPKTGEQLTAKLLKDRISYWDVTASVPKGVTVALEGGDQRIQDALWEAGRETMADLEKMITTRMKGGRDGEKISGNMIWFGFEHPETRPAKADNLPDPDRHIHFVIPNVTWSEEAGQWQAIRWRPIQESRKWFDRRFDMRVASKLADLGYEIETKYKAGKYYSWDIKGIPQSVVTKFSRRAAEVEKLAKELGVASAMGKDKLGATSRQFKRKDMTLDDYRKYWMSRITPAEGKAIEETIEAARDGLNPLPVNTADQGAQYAIAHEFYRNSVVEEKALEITAMERSMGGALLEEIGPELVRQGVLLKGGEATTREVLEEESRIIQFAREGKGTMRPLGVAAGEAVTSKIDTVTLSAEQQAVCEHIWSSTDRCVLVEGDAGSGKTQSMQRTIPGISAPGVFLAPSASASRGTLREKGFTNADTIAKFLSDARFREQARGGYIYIDEAPLAGIKDMAQVFGHAKALNARVILQGDRKQHTSPARHGNLFPTLEQFAGLPIGRLKENWRQRNKDYKAAVNLIAAGKVSAGFDALDALGWVKKDGLVDDYIEQVRKGKSVIVIAPTHKAGDALTEEIRGRLKEEGRLGEERIVETLVPQHWTDAEKLDPARYSDEVVQFHRNSGSFRAGERVRGADVFGARKPPKPEHFSVYSRRSIAIAPGEHIRITAGGYAFDADGGKHQLENGSQYTVSGFTKEGDVALENGWALKTPHFTRAYVSTSFGAQGKTVDVALAAMGSESLAAINQQQFYVTASRARDRFTLYHSGLSKDDLREAIQKQGKRKSATELMGAPVILSYAAHVAEQKRLSFLRRAWGRLREAAAHVIRPLVPEQRYGFAR